LILQILYHQYKMEIAKGGVILPPLTYGQVLSHMLQVCERNGYSQIPQLSSSRPLRIDKDPFRIVPPNFRPKRGHTKRALLIGINYKNTPFELKGCHNDVQNMKLYLQHVHDFEDKNIWCVLDSADSKIQPTRTNLMRIFQQFALSCREGDAVVFLFAGHGVSVEDTSGDESDGYDEAMMPCDYLASGEGEEEGAEPIIDDDIFRLLLIPMPKNVHVTAIVDCCHSGTILDLPFDYTLRRRRQQESQHKDGATSTANSFECDYDMVRFPHMHMVQEYELKMQSIMSDQNGGLVVVDKPKTQQLQSQQQQPNGRGDHRHHAKHHHVGKHKPSTSRQGRERNRHQDGGQSRGQGRDHHTTKRKSRSLEPSTKLGGPTQQDRKSWTEQQQQQQSTAKPIRRGTRPFPPISPQQKSPTTKTASATIPLSPFASPAKNARTTSNTMKHEPMSAGSGVKSRMKRLPLHLNNNPSSLSLSPQPRAATKARAHSSSRVGERSPVVVKRHPRKKDVDHLSRTTRSLSPTRNIKSPPHRSVQSRSAVRASPKPTKSPPTRRERQSIPKPPFGMSSRTDMDCGRDKADHLLNRRKDIPMVARPKQRADPSQQGSGNGYHQHHSPRESNGTTVNKHKKVETTPKSVTNAAAAATHKKGNRTGGGGTTFHNVMLESPRTPTRSPKKKYGRHATVGLSPNGKPKLSPPFRSSTDRELEEHKPVTKTVANRSPASKSSPRSHSSSNQPKERSTAGSGYNNKTSLTSTPVSPQRQQYMMNRKINESPSRAPSPDRHYYYETAVAKSPTKDRTKVPHSPNHPPPRPRATAPATGAVVEMPSSLPLTSIDSTHHPRKPKASRCLSVD
jgi:Caspase domain